MFRSLARVAAFLLAAYAVFTLTGCTTWKLSHMPPAEFVQSKHPRAVRLTLVDARVVPVMYPVIERDSLSGYLGTHDASEVTLSSDHYRYPRVSLPLSDVRKLEWQGVSAVKTTFAVIGIGATVALLTAAILISAESEPYVPTSSSSGGGSGGDYVSCPRIYSWDGDRWWLDSGTYGGAILEPLARTDVDNLEHASAHDGRIELRMADEAPETEFVDAVSLVAVDHAPGTNVAPDSRGQIYAFADMEAPLAAKDFDGVDALSRVCEADDRSWESGLRPRDPARANELKDGLELTFPKPKIPRQSLLVLTGHNTPWAAYLLGEAIQAHGSEEPAWQANARAHPEEMRAAARQTMSNGMLEVSIWGATGWEKVGTLWEAGPEVAKQQVMPVDFSRVRGDLVRVRVSSIPSFWLIDQIGLATRSAARFFQKELSLVSAADSTGQDVRPLLKANDGRTHLMKRGDAAHLSFRAPTIRKGYRRTYLSRASGWYRVDCDTTRAPNRKLLARLATEPGATSRIAVERANQALQVAQEV